VRAFTPTRSRADSSAARGDVFVLAPPCVTPDTLLDQIGDILAAATRAVLG
jgi:hypothetical protein